MKLSRLPFAFRLATAVALTLSARAANITWVGNNSVNWADPNWSGTNNPPIANDILIFGVAGSAGAILNNDQPVNRQFNGITFNAGASAFTFNGNAITLGGSLTNNSTSLQTINLPIAVTATRTFQTAVGGGNLVLGGVLSGAGGYSAAGVGTITITNTANTFTGEQIIGNGAANVASTIVNVASLSNYGVASSIGARTAAAENNGTTGIGLHFRGGTLQYTGSTPQSTNRQIRILNGTAGGIIDASGTDPSATLSFTYTGANTNLFDTAGTRTLTLTGTNTGNNSFSIQLIDQGANFTSLQKTGIGTWRIANSDNSYRGETIIVSGILNVASVSDYGVNSSIGGRLLSDENTSLTGVSLHFQGGTLQYTGSTPQSTNRNIRIINGNGATLDASGSVPSATLSFTKTGTNINLFDTPGERTLTLTGTNTGDNGFSIPLLNQAGFPTHLAKTGIGTWVLNGPDSNVNTGATSVSDGTLKLAKTGATAVTGPLNIVDGTVVLGGTGGNQIDNAVVVSFTGSNSAAGILRLANNTETIGGLSSFAVGIVENESGAAGTGTLTVNTTAPQSFGGILRDGDGVGTDGALSLVKTGAGTLTFSGTSTHTGATMVNAGTLTITGSLGAGTLLTISNATGDGFGTIEGNVNVQNGGTLANDGTIGGNINLAAGGTLSGTSLIAGLVTAGSGSHISPAGGAFPGTIFTAGLTLGNGSLLDYELGGSSDLVAITVANGLTINGGAFNVFEPGGASPLLTNGTYTLLDYDTSFTGVITNLSIANSQFGKFYTIANNTTNTLITLTVIDTTISEWTGGAADGLWSSGGNWSMGVPNAAGAVARFGSMPAVPTTVGVNGAKTVGGILFENANSYTITGGAAEPITLNNGFAAATMTVTNGNHTITAPIVLTTSANSTTAAGTTLTLAGDISGAKTFIAAGLGATILTGTNSFAATNVNGGTLQIGNNGTTGTLGTDDVTIAPGATLVFHRSNDLTVSNNIFGADATVTKLGAGTLALTGSNTFATSALGGFNINEGTVKLSSAGALPSGVRLNFGGGTLDLNERNLTVGFLSGTSGSITDAGAAAGTTTLTVNQATDSTYGGTINNGAGRTLAVTKSGVATLTLTGSNTFTGPLNITNGAVIAAGDAAVPIVSNVNLGDGSNDVWLIAGAFGNQFGASTEINFTNAAKNAKFQLRGFNQTVAGLNANLDSQTSLAIIQNDETIAPGYIGDPGAANLTIDTATNHVFTGLIRNQNGGALGLIKEGTGTQEIRNVLVGADSFSSITVNNGIFRINFSTNANGTNVLVAGTSILVNPGGTLALTGTTNIAGPISGTGPILIHGTDTVTPSGDNSAYSGTLTLDSGTLGIGSNTALGTGPVIINGGIFRASGAGRVVTNFVTANGSFTLGRLTDFANPLTLGADITITANNFDGAANADSRFNGGITGPFGVTFAEGPQGLGTGALVIAVANTNASTTVVSGRVTVEDSGFLANGPLTMNGGILNLNNSLQDVTSFAGTGGTVNLGAGNELRTTQSGNTTFSGVLAGAGGINKDGSGKLTLTGANTFSGGTTIDGGILSVNANNGLGAAAGPVLIENDAALQAGGTLSIATRTVTLGQGGGTIDTNGNTVTLAAGSTVTGTELTKIGAGKLAILGVQTYDTLTTEAGRTDLGTALGTGTSTINASATTNLGVSQRLAALNIGAGGVVTLGALPPAPLAEGEEAAIGNDSLALNEESASDLAGTAAQAVPEPGTVSLLLFGALSLLGRRRRGDITTPP